jgi:hypothetical protein
MLIPDSNLLVTGGKDGRFYLIDRGAMGHKNSMDDSQIVQSFQVTQNHFFNAHRGMNDWFNIHGGPVYYNGPKGRLVYVCGEEEPIKAYRLTTTGGVLKFESATPFQQSIIRAPFRHTSDITNGRAVLMPGALLAISANGSTAGIGIVWASMPFDNTANQQVVPGILRAFDASDLTKELWNSRQNLNRDNLGMHPKFCAPTVADGKVFMTAFFAEKIVNGDNMIDSAPGKERAALVVYGLLGP